MLTIWCIKPDGLAPRGEAVEPTRDWRSHYFTSSKSPGFHEPSNAAFCGP
jgi:hypothetical protein